MADKGGLKPEMASRTGSSSNRPSLIHSVSCPDNLPQLTITTSDDPAHSAEPLQIPGTPSTTCRLDGNETDSTASTATDSESASDAESGIDEKKHNMSAPSKADKVPSNDKDSADTLVEAALDKAEAQDRHVRFQDHVVESAALVERMLNRRGAQEDQSSERLSQKFRRNSAFDEEEMEDGDTFSNQGSRDDNGLSSDGMAFSGPMAGGSVLASLMKLEAQRRANENELERKRRKERKQGAKKAKSKSSSSSKKKKNNKPASLYDVPFHSSTDPLSAQPKRPKMVNRPCSWLSTMTASNHLVPSLEKKKLMSPSVSRRSSVDSMLTTASQFEPITLEDRIRITFEIANILQKQEFLCKLARCLMLYGCPAHRLEYAMRQVSKTIGVDAEYIYFPNVMFVTFFDQSTHTTETHFIRQSQTFEMHKLAEIYRLEKLVAHGEVSVDEALQFIDKVANEPRFYPLWLNPFVYGLASFCGCLLFFGGYWTDAAVSAGLAMIFAIYEFVSGRIQSLQAIWEITVCILIGFVAKAVTKYAFCFTPIAFSAFIVILPGYPMAVAVVELVSRQLVSGVVRMVYSIIYAFLLGYGIQMGSELYSTIDKSVDNIPEAWVQECSRATNVTTCDARINKSFFALLVPLFALAYCIFVRARPFRWPTMIVVSAIGYVVNFALSCWARAPSQVLQVVPAFTIGFIGNLLTKITGKMSFDAVLLGVFYLVPGGLGIKAGYGMFDSSDNSLGTQGASFALAMIESSIGITVGLFVATLIVYPKGSKNTPLMNF